MMKNLVALTKMMKPALPLTMTMMASCSSCCLARTSFVVVVVLLFRLLEKNIASLFVFAPTSESGAILKIPPISSPHIFLVLLCNRSSHLITSK